MLRNTGAAHGQMSLLAQFDAGLAARKRAANGEEENAVAEFNRTVRLHFLGKLPTRGKYAPDPADS